MIFDRLGLINKNQRGITLVELLVAVAITGIITGGITMTIFQVFGGNERTSNHMTAVRQVQNAGYWISHNTQMAQDIVTGDDPTGTGFPLTLTSTDWESGDVHQVIYTLLVNNKLQREHYTNLNLDATTIVAQYIDPDQTSCVWDDAEGKLTLTVTATVSGWKSASETRIYEVIPRPGS